MYDFLFLNVGLCNEAMEFPNWMIDFAKMKYVTFSFEQFLYHLTIFSYKNIEEIEISRWLFEPTVR